MEKSKVDAVILAGGFGKRIKKFSKGKPKPIIKFNNYIFIDLLIRNLSKYNINKIYILAGYKGEQIKNIYHKKKINFVDIECVIENKPLGTAGCLSQLKKKISNDFIVMNGDTFFDIDISKVIKYRLKNNQIFISLATNHNYKSNSKLTNLSLSNKKVIYKKNSRLINGGIYKFTKSFLKNIKRKNYSLETDVLPAMILKKNVFGLNFKNFFIDIGTPKNFIMAKKKLVKYLKRPAIFLDRDGTLNKDNGYTYKTKDLHFLNGVIKGLKFLSKKNFYIFIVTNQAGIGKGYFKLSQFLKFQENFKKILLKKGIFIHDVEFSPYHPDAKIKKFRKKTLLRKPGNLMIKNLQKKWPLSMSKSFMIGDKKTDELCAKKSGIKFLYSTNNFYNLVKNKINNY